jgi:peptide/nickel transport system permease protein
MTRFILKRLGLAVITLFLVSIVLFVTAEVAPGDIGRKIAGPYATADQVALINRELGVDRPLYIRYPEWLAGFVTGDWGKSYLLGVEVRPYVLERLGNSLILGAYALLLVVPLSILLGIVAALNYGKALDRLISVTGLSLLALPEFVAGVLLIVVFAVGLGWFPASANVPTSLLDVPYQLTLPALPLVLVLFGYISRMARAGTVDALQSNYTRTAVLKGLPRRTVVFRHVLRNSLLPTISVVAVQIGYLVGGLVVIETLFNYPGIGKLVIDSATGDDLPILEATVLIAAILFMVTNLIADILYGVLNPRVRLASSN